MTDHRALQRTLVRMQFDAAFARAIRAGKPRAVASTGLDAADLAVLQAADPAGVSADPGGRRRAQLLGNVTAEFVATVAYAARSAAAAAAVHPGAGAEPAGVAAFAHGFVASGAFHGAVARDGSLSVAFGEWAQGVAGGDSLLAALALLETTVARARRGARTGSEAPPAGGVALAPGAWLLELPQKTADFAEALRAEFRGAGGASAAPETAGDVARETVLIVAGPPDARRSPAVHVEVLDDAVARLLLAARGGATLPTLAAVTALDGADSAETASFIDELVGQRVLVRG